MPKKIQNNRGFTLLEIIIAIALVAILAGIGAISANRYLPVYRLREATRDIVSTLQDARLNAVRRSSVCAVTYNVLGGSYVAFVDANQNFQQDAGENQLSSVQLANYQYVNYGIAGISFPANGNGNPTIAFNNRGLPLYNGGIIGTFGVSLQNTQGHQRQAAVSPSGNIRLQ